MTGVSDREQRGHRTKPPNARSLSSTIPGYNARGSASTYSSASSRRGDREVTGASDREQRAYCTKPPNSRSLSSTIPGYTVTGNARIYSNTSSRRGDSVENSPHTNFRQHDACHTDEDPAASNYKMQELDSARCSDIEEGNVPVSLDTGTSQV